MGWGTFQAVRQSWTSADTHVAVATASGQIPAVLIVRMAMLSGEDDYGVSYNSFGLLFVLLFGPLWVPLAGLLQVALLNGPAGVLAALATLKGRRTLRGDRTLEGHRTLEGRRTLKGYCPPWLCYLGATATVSALWATLAASCLDASFLSTTATLTALGTLPTLAVLAVRRWGRSWSVRGVWWRSVPASIALFFVAFLGFIAADAAGLVPQYDPPRLSVDQLTGVWRGARGAELRLSPGGGAEATALPAERADGDWLAENNVCTATGTWSLDTEGRYDRWRGEGPEERDGAVVRLEGCGADTYWVIGGTTDSPELFVLFGDPDAGDVRILRPA
ncbi:MAG TPA: hypothetical protein VIU15_09235 [Streptomyces sp.]